MTMWIGPKLKVWGVGFVCGALTWGLGVGVDWGELADFGNRLGSGVEAFQVPSSSVPVAPTDPTVVVTP